MWIRSIQNTGVIQDQVVTGTDDVEAKELSLPFEVSKRSRIYVHAILSVTPERLEKAEKLLAKIELTKSGSEAEPLQYGPYGYRTSDPYAQCSFVVGTDFAVDPGAEYTVKVVVSVSMTGTDAYRLRPQGNCRMTLIAVPETNAGEVVVVAPG
jgi:hypothetical protein